MTRAGVDAGALPPTKAALNAGPVEQVSEAAVGDHDVGKGVGPSRHDCERRLVRLGLKSESQYATASPRLVTGADTRIHPSAHNLDVLLRERTAMRCPRKRDRLSAFAASIIGRVQAADGLGRISDRPL